MALLRHLALRCRDMENSRRFYEEVIGWKFVGYRPSKQGIDLSDGTSNITLLQHGNEPPRPVFEEGTEYIHFGVIVPDLSAVWNKAQAWGAKLAREDVKARNEVDDHTLPVKSFKVLDPDGNVVDVTCDRQEWKGAIA